MLSSIRASANPKVGKTSKTDLRWLSTKNSGIHLLELVERHRKTFDEERRFELRHKIARLSRYLLECKAIWQKYSPWEENSSSQT